MIKRTGTWPPVCDWPECEEPRDLSGKGRHDLCVKHVVVDRERRERAMRKEVTK